jgi:hypothetical protein
MSWTYQISSGTLLDPTGATVGHGYAGHGEGLNNPALCNVRDVGPLPQGTYTIGQPINDNQVGVFAMPLTPDPSNEMFGRSAFFIHGDNPELNHTASDGCIILIHPIRVQIAASTDNTLIVEA